jgi:YD repeat-containing protein
MQKRLANISNDMHDPRLRYGWYLLYYNNRMYIPQLLTKKEYDYSSDGTGKIIENTTRYVYKSFSFMPNQFITSTAATDSSVLEYRYPLLASSNVEDINYKLYEKNVLIPVETVMKIKTGSVEKVVGSTANVYANFNGRLMLQSQYSLDLKTPISDFSYMVGSSLDSRYRLKTVYDKYAKSGELLQYHENFGPPVSLVWGMKNSIMLAKITGIDYDVVKANIDTLNLNKLTATQSFVTSELAKIRALNKTLNITSNYTHPITGVLASIDNTGKSETYTYDQFGRLSTILDTKQNIVRGHTYNIFDAQANDLEVSKWVKTGNTRCITINGITTGEEEVEEKYTDASNINNNKLRWRSIGYTNKCIIK